MLDTEECKATWVQSRDGVALGVGTGRTQEYGEAAGTGTEDGLEGMGMDQDGEVEGLVLSRRHQGRGTG